jgi:hypothetical protein
VAYRSPTPASSSSSSASAPNDTFDQTLDADALAALFDEETPTTPPFGEVPYIPAPLPPAPPNHYDPSRDPRIHPAARIVMATAAITIISVFAGLQMAYTAARSVFRGGATVHESADPQQLWTAGLAATESLRVAQDNLLQVPAGGANNTPPTVQCPPPGDRLAFSRWTLAVRATVAAHSGWFGLAGRLHAWMLAQFADNHEVLDLYVAEPFSGNTHMDRAELMIELRKLDGMEAIFGVTEAERRATATAEYAAWYQGDKAFGAFYAGLITRAIKANRTTMADAEHDDGFVADLVRKTRKELRERIITSAGTSLPTHREFCRLGIALDAVTPRPERTTRARAFVLPAAPHAVLMKSAKWVDDVPKEFRGKLRKNDGTRDMALQNRLTTANRCWFCRQTGHGTGAAATAACPRGGGLGRDPVRLELNAELDNTGAQSSDPNSE